MDFITDLSPCGGFNWLYTCVDKLIRFVNLILILIREEALSAPEVACFFFEHVVQLFGIAHMVLYDCDASFIAHFWCCLWELLGSWVALFLAYHP